MKHPNSGTELGSTAWKMSRCMCLKVWSSQFYCFVISSLDDAQRLNFFLLFLTLLIHTVKASQMH